MPEEKEITIRLDLIVGVIVTIVVVCGLTSWVINLFDSTKVSVSQSIDEPWNNPEVLKANVSVGNTVWTVTGAKNLGSKLKAKNSYSKDCVASSGKFIRVEIIFKNKGTEPVTLTDIPLFDENKFEYEASSSVDDCVEGTIFISEKINPGIEKKYVAVYEVPLESKGYRIRVDDTTLISDKKYIAIGF